MESTRKVVARRVMFLSERVVAQCKRIVHLSYQGCVISQNIPSPLERASIERRE